MTLKITIAAPTVLPSIVSTVGSVVQATGAIVTQTGQAITTAGSTLVSAGGGTVVQNPAVVRAYMRHVRQQGVCSRGARDWWEKHALDWNDFLTNGIPVDTLEQTGDTVAAEVAALARQEAGDGIK